MLRAEPLLKIQLMMLASEAQDAALSLARFGVFSPAACTLDMLAESPAATYREAWLEADARRQRYRKTRLQLAHPAIREDFRSVRLRVPAID